MNEKELAAELQAGKNDAEEWGDPTATDPDVAEQGANDFADKPKRRLAAMVSVRLSPEELEAVQARAVKRGETVSAYLRGMALRDIAGTATPFRVTGFVSLGDPYISKVDNSLIVTDGGRMLTRAS